MADETTIALAGIAAASLTPLASAWLEGKREKRRFAYERREKDTDDIRKLFDKVADQLALARDRTSGALAFFELTERPSPGDVTTYRDQVRGVSSVRDELIRLNVRVGVRVPWQDDNSAWQVLKRIDGVLIDFTIVASDHFHGAATRPPSAEGKKELTDIALRFSAAYGEFLTVAQGLVGARLAPGRPSDRGVFHLWRFTRRSED